MAKEEFARERRNDGRLYLAVVRGDFKTVVQELNSGDVDLSLRIGGKSFLRHAGEHGFKRIADQLIKHGGLDPNEVYGKRQRSLLHLAAATFNFGFASVLLENGANHSAQTTNGATPLHFAARSGQSYLAIQLIDAGANVSAEDNLGRTPLSLSFKKGMTGTAKLLVDRGARQATQEMKQPQKSRVAESGGMGELVIN